MNVDVDDPATLLQIFLFLLIAPPLISAISSISDGKSTVVSEILAAGSSTQEPGLKLVFVGVAVIAFLSIPTWGILWTLFKGIGE